MERSVEVELAGAGEKIAGEGADFIAELAHVFGMGEGVGHALETARQRHFGGLAPGGLQPEIELGRHGAKPGAQA